MKDGVINNPQPDNINPPSKATKTVPNQPVDQNRAPFADGGKGQLQPPLASRQATKGKKKCRYTRDPGMFWLGVATLFVVAVYAYFAHQQAVATQSAADAANSASKAAVSQLLLTRRQVEDSKRDFESTLHQMEAQTVAQQRAATAASKAADTAQESLESVQRAFVSFGGITETNAPNPGSKTDIDWLFQARWENSGTTPAKIVDMYIQAGPLPSEPDRDVFIGEETQSGGSNVVIGGKARVDTTSRRVNPPPSAQPSQVLKGPGTLLLKKGIFIWGWIVYKDVFPRTKAHLSEFSVYVNGVRYDMGGKTQMGFIPSDTHNCVDEDCEDYERIISQTIRRH